MPIFVKYQLQIEGQKVVERSMEALEQRADRLNRRTARAAPGNQSRAGAQAEREAERQAKAKARAEEKAAAAGVRAHDRAERDKTRTAIAESKKRAAAEERLSKQHQDYQRKLRDQHFREEERRTLRSKANWANTTRGVVGGTARGVSSFATGAIALAGIGGTALAANAMHGYMRDKASASSLANQVAGKDASVADIQKVKGQLLASAQQIKGASAEEVMRGQSAFHSVAGEGEATKKIGQKLVTAQLATGGDMGDIGSMYSEVYASLRNASGGANKTVDQLIEETDKLGRVFAAMGAKGAIELKDFARIGATIGAVSGQYAGDASENLKYTAAAAQVARQSGGAPSAEEAATAIQSFAADLVQHSKDARLMGVDVFADKGKTKLKQFPEMVAELMAGTGGNLEKIQTVNNIRGVKALRGYSTPYLEAYDAAKKGGASEKVAKEAGKAAVIGKVKSFAAEEYSEQRFSAAAESRLSDEDKQIDAAMKELNVAIGTQLVPVVTQLIPELAKLTPYVVSAASAVAGFVKAFAQNPVQGLGAIIGAFFLKELAAAQMGKLLTIALTTTAGTVTSPLGGISSTKGKVGGALGAVGAAAAGFAITDAIINIAGDARVNSAASASQQLGKLSEGYNEQRAAILGSDASDEEKAKQLQNLGTNTWKNVNLTQEAGAGGVMSMMPDWFRQVFDSGTAMNVDKGADAMRQQINKDMAEAASKLSAAADKIAGTTPNRSNTKSPVI